MSDPAEGQAIERLISVNINALQVYETHPNHATFGLQEWLPMIADEILNDYVIVY